jgi:hypothetical protein
MVSVMCVYVSHLKASCYSNIVGGQPCDLYVVESIPQPNSAFPYIWPMPQQFTNGSINVTVDALGFYFLPNVSDPDLDAAIKRYKKLIFPKPSVTPPSAAVISGVFINV